MINGGVDVDIGIGNGSDVGGSIGGVSMIGVGLVVWT